MGSNQSKHTASALKAVERFGKISPAHLSMAFPGGPAKTHVTVVIAMDETTLITKKVPFEELDTPCHLMARLCERSGSARAIMEGLDNMAQVKDMRSCWTVRALDGYGSGVSMKQWWVCPPTAAHYTLDIMREGYQSSSSIEYDSVVGSNVVVVDVGVGLEGVANHFRMRCGHCRAMPAVSKCARCSQHYCNVVCQRLHWRAHKNTCGTDADTYSANPFTIMIDM